MRLESTIIVDRYIDEDLITVADNLEKKIDTCTLSHSKAKVNFSYEFQKLLMYCCDPFILVADEKL